MREDAEKRIRNVIKKHAKRYAEVWSKGDPKLARELEDAFTFGGWNGAKYVLNEVRDTLTPVAELAKAFND